MWQLKIVGWGHCLNIIKASVCAWIILALVQFIIMFLGETLYMHTLSLGISPPCIVGSKYTAVLQTVSLTWKHVQHAEGIVGECWGGLRFLIKVYGALVWRKEKPDLVKSFFQTTSWLSSVKLSPLLA